MIKIVYILSQNSLIVKLLIYGDSSLPHLKIWVKKLSKKIDQIVVIDRTNKMSVTDNVIKYYDDLNIKLIFGIYQPNYLHKIKNRLKRIFNSHSFPYYSNRAKILDKLINIEEPDIFHIHSLFDRSILFLNKSPDVLTIYGSETSDQNFLSIFSDDIISNLNNIKFIQSTSYTILKQFSHIFKFSPSKTRIYPWGVDNELFSIDNYDENKCEKIKSKYKIPKNDLILISNRGVSDTYNIKLQIEIFKNLYLTNLTIIIIAGFTNQELIEQYKSIFDNNNFLANIIFIDKILTQEELADLLYISNYLISIPNSDNMASSIIEGIFMNTYPILFSNDAYLEYLPNDKVFYIKKETDIHSISKQIQDLLSIHKPKLDIAFVSHLKSIFNWSNAISNQYNVYEEVFSK